MTFCVSRVEARRTVSFKAEERVISIRLLKIGGGAEATRANEGASLSQRAAAVQS
jgi:hypothetical protein